MTTSPASVEWRQGACRGHVSAGTVDVWRARLDLPAQTRARLHETLAPDERHRADRFCFERDRTRFIAGRGILRSVLSRYLRQRPEYVAFSYNSYAKPELAGASRDSGLRFNVSHSAEMLLIAVASGHQVGVDVERLRDGVLDLAERVFSPREVVALRALAPSGQIEAFFRCWTCKEAYVKGRGQGLSIPLHEFDVSFGSPPTLLQTRHDPPEAAQWSMYDVTPGHGFIGTLAVRAREVALRRWEWAPW